MTAIPALYGVTDGKAVGTYVEHAFIAHLALTYEFDKGNSAKGIDIPSLDIDLKVTSIKQPQSSSPFRDATQKVYGLGYGLLVFVYEKADDPVGQAAQLDILHAILIDRALTADYTLTRGLKQILEADGGVDDVDAYLQDRNLPLDPDSRRTLAERILLEPPALGQLTISNALQWRLQYGHAIRAALTGGMDGVVDLRAQR
ncbi:MAG TPA: hypothetical protein VGB75_19795 [Jatrophihabitans sp.]|uniref:restriction endonuclease n=1 Tax=Jatrophihabitans sp. TaxID=1932789 RepID=UPI002EDE88BD